MRTNKTEQNSSGNLIFEVQVVILKRVISGDGHEAALSSADRIGIL